jgi:hypothetical protein
MSEPIRNRIQGHRRVRAGDLVPPEFNFRVHPEGQRAALQALCREVGFARSLLAYELPEGRLKLLDGHLRRDLDPDLEVDVEVLDVTDYEARALLLSIDPLAALAETQEQLHERLLELTPTDSEDLRAAWEAAARACLEGPARAGAAEGGDGAGAMVRAGHVPRRVAAGGAAGALDRRGAGVPGLIVVTGDRQPDVGHGTEWQTAPPTLCLTGVRAFR